jgi:hypothetical protein
MIVVYFVRGWGILPQLQTIPTEAQHRMRVASNL